MELAPSGTVSIQRGVRLFVGARESQSFDWATVGVAGIQRVAEAADLVVVDMVNFVGRYVATLRHRAWAASPSV